MCLFGHLQDPWLEMCLIFLFFHKNMFNAETTLSFGIISFVQEKYNQGNLNLRPCKSLQVCRQISRKAPKGNARKHAVSLETLQLKNIKRIKCIPLPAVMLSYFTVQ